MAATFEFSSNVLNLSIAGHQFQVDISARDVQTNMQEVIQSAELLSQTDSDNVQKVMDLCVQGIDGLLGTDATKTIFGDKRHPGAFSDLRRPSNHRIDSVRIGKLSQHGIR